MKNVHGEKKSVEDAASEIAQALDSMQQVERRLVALIRLQEADSARKLIAKATVYTEGRAAGEQIDVEVPVSQLISELQYNLSDQRTALSFHYQELNEATNRLVGYRVHQALVGPGRVS